LWRQAAGEYASPMIGYCARLQPAAHTICNQRTWNRRGEPGVRPCDWANTRFAPTE
jgi:hypothetical protein